MNPIKWLVISIFAAAGIGLLLFGPRDIEALPKDRVIIDYWEKWTGNEEAQMREIVDDFNKTVGAEKGIFVRYISISGINQKVMVATAAGVPPDIAGLYDNNLVQFAAMDALEPLEDLARERGITAAYYKPVFWNACNYNGHLYGLISTPMAVALHYNKKMFADNADKLRAAGLDPERPPQTIDELDAYAKALTTFDAAGRPTLTAFLPLEPNWFINETCFWFGSDFFDVKTRRFTLTDPKVVRAYEWIASYSKWLGKDAMNDFRSGFGNFDSPQNAFLAGQVAMEQQGPWMANFIYKLKPSMSTVLWPKEVELTKPLDERRKNYEWAVEAFPSAVPGLKDVTYCGFDAMTIPKGAKHKKEAFEFIAYVQRQDVIEKLNKMHCKGSPLAKVSEGFFEGHPNPYIDVFERLTASPNARALAQIPIMPQVLDELNVLVQKVSALQVEPKEALEELQVRLQAKYDAWVEQQKSRGSNAR
ncbi:MAG: extracellular solute-binding protein [Anaerolineae bacterium]|nr:extracellular solute-binding protein [Phycisphaerae bacterium]